MEQSIRLPLLPFAVAFLFSIAVLPLFVIP
jgi:hypothetical protein